jgi:uncharacterized membrane protein
VQDNVRMNANLSRITPASPRDERVGLPEWFWLTIPPLAAPWAAAVWLRAHWQEIPSRFPIHYGTSGADRWASRTALHVYGPLIFAEGLVLLMLGIGLVTYYNTRRPPAGSAGEEKIFLVVMYLMSLIFSGVGLMPVMRFSPWILPAVIVPGVIGLIAWMAKRNAATDDPPDDTPAERWSLGGIYSNPQDPALFVPKRMGFGYTLNFGNRWAKPFLAGTIIAVGGLTAFLMWALR